MVVGVILGWALVGAVATGLLVTFWDSIRSWLNNVAANAIERAFGYSARNKMQRAVVKIDRFMDKVRNRSTIYAKENRLDTHYIKTDIVAEADPYSVDNKVLEEIRNKKELVEEYKYNM